MRVPSRVATVSMESWSVPGFPVALPGFLTADSFPAIAVEAIAAAAAVPAMRSWRRGMAGVLMGCLRWFSMRWAVPAGADIEIGYGRVSDAAGSRVRPLAAGLWRERQYRPDDRAPQSRAGGAGIFTVAPASQKQL